MANGGEPCRHKQADENMDKMKQALVGTMTYFQLVYPGDRFQHQP